MPYLKPALLAVALLALMALLFYQSRRGTEKDNARMRAESDKYHSWNAWVQQKGCGQDLVVSVDRFGALPTPQCWKVVCLNRPESIYLGGGRACYEAFEPSQSFR